MTKKFDYSQDLPYNPGFDNIETSTIPLNTTHYNNVKEAEGHVLASIMQTYSSYNHFKRQNVDRPFVLTRSGTLGSNKYGFHYTGENKADF